METTKTIPITAVQPELPGGIDACASAEPFALMVLGDSMMPEFEERDIVIVEPDGLADDGAFVLAHVQDNEAHAYFVHSFAFGVAHDRDVVASTDYGGPFAAVLARDNMIGTQFHPEKSQAVGLQLLQNFARWRP